MSGTATLEVTLERERARSKEYLGKINSLDDDLKKLHAQFEEQQENLRVLRKALEYFVDNG
jgi:hypothetical protein